MKKLTFTGHETFHCRHFWLKKGYDFYLQHQNPSIEDAILQLGVGKNMVSAIDYWLRAFYLKDEEKQITEMAEKIFQEDKGYDPYLENVGTLWLLQYYLVKTEIASIYSLVFKDFRKTRIDAQFTSQQLLRYLLREVDKSGTTAGENTLKNDIKVFIRTYFLNNKSQKDLEDDLSSLLLDLSLLQKIDSNSLEEGEYFKINVTDRKEIPKEIFLFTILDSFPEEVSISFDLIKDKIADGFACNDEGLELKIQEITEVYDFTTYKEDAGRKELQFKYRPDKWNILHDYYQA